MDIKTDYEEVFYGPFVDYLDCQTDPPVNFCNSDFEMPRDLFKAIRSCLDALSCELSKPYNNEFISNTLTEIREMLLTKNADYGNAAFTAPCYAPSLDPATAILVRMSDKVNRYKNLVRRTGTQVWESKVDTLKDYIGYAILLTLAVYGDGVNEEPAAKPLDGKKLVLLYDPEMSLGEIQESLANGKVTIYPGN